jgi:hypothetical protein
MEVLEVLMMYGYKLEIKDDLHTICEQFVTTAEDGPNYNLLKMVKFYLAATAGSKLAVRDSPSDIISMISLPELLSRSPTGTTPPMMQLARVELVRVLLQAGANPNPSKSLAMIANDSFFFPPLSWAIRNNDNEIAKLLIKFGAEEMSLVEDFPWSHTSGFYETVEISTLAVAEENGMLDLLLDRPATPVVVNASDYIQHLRLEITKPLRLAISEIIVVAFMRGTGQPPPMGVILYSILSFCKFLDYDWTAASPHLRQTS